MKCRKPGFLGKSHSVYSKTQISKGLFGRDGACKGEKHYRWNPDREQVLARSKMYAACTRMLKRALIGQKSNSTSKILGYSTDDLRVHLESRFNEGMSWCNYGMGDDKWHIDHIRPVSDFEVGQHPSVVNALYNLQPLWQHDNLKKGAKV